MHFLGTRNYCISRERFNIVNAIQIIDSVVNFKIKS